MNTKVGITLNTTGLDEVIEKVERLAELLREVQQIISQLPGKVELET